MMKKYNLKKLSNFAYFGTTFIFLTISDLYISNLIANKVLNGWHFANKFFEITYIENTGAAFSIFQNSTKLLITLSIIAILGMFYYLANNIEGTKKIAILLFSLFLAGVAGNLYERLAFGYVRDFFNLTFTTFPIFNISDILINIGVLGIMCMIIFSKKFGK